VDAVRDGAPLWQLITLLAPPAAGLDAGLRAAAVLCGGLAVIDAVRRCRSACVARLALGAYAALIAVSAALPVGGGLWLVPLAGLWLIRGHEASTLTALAVTCWVLADHAWLWLMSLRVLGAGGPSSVSPGLLEGVFEPPRFVAPVWVLAPAWLVAAGRFAPRQGGRSGWTLTLPSLLPALVAFGVWGHVLDTHSSRALVPLPTRTVIRHGLPIVGGDSLPDCALVVSPGATTSSSRASGCRAIELVGVGPSLRVDPRSARLGPALAVPDTPRASSLPLELRSTAGGLEVPSGAELDIDARGWLTMDGIPQYVLSAGDVVVIAVDADTPAANVAVWADALAAHRIGLALTRSPR